MLAAQGQELEGSLQSLKLREGFDTLSQDAQAEVLGRLRDGAPFQTKAEVAVPSLGELQAQFPARLQGALDQALDLLDELRADRGEKPTVTVTLHTSGRELDSEAALERFLAELRAQLLKELQSGHRVRLK